MATDRRMLNDPMNSTPFRSRNKETKVRDQYVDHLGAREGVSGGHRKLEEQGERFQAFPRNPEQSQYRAAPFHANGFDTSENLERDRAELLRKLEQLNHEISRTKEDQSDCYNGRFTRYGGPASSTCGYAKKVTSSSVLPRKIGDPLGTQVMGMVNKHASHRDVTRPIWFRQKDSDPSGFGFQGQPQVYEMQAVDSGLDDPENPGQTNTKHAVALSKRRKCAIVIAGGAPFIICSNCFELLILPRGLRTKKNGKEVQCGSCSALICIRLEENRWVSCVIGNPQEEAEDNSGSPGASDYGCIKPCGDTEEKFSGTRSEEKAFSGEPETAIILDEKMIVYGPSSSSSSSSGESSSRVTVGRNNGTSPATHGYKKVSSCDSPYVSADSSKEEGQPTNSKAGAGRSLLEGLVKRRIKDGRSVPKPITKNEAAKVTVNGYFLPNDVVKQAEIHAGPISPGDYWYDYHSGFWGLMKGPCLGVTSPFIEEFNYLLPTNCSGGDTGVFVNGRQLHQQDLEFLAGKGLPRTRNQFYIIDIFGKVIDEDTGDELYDLGDLAPQVVKAGRGLGMRA
ncbi:hypothetical protein SAY86_013187 [Trapa natans]|uniref:Probable zinc-ribbon domain-containing protein n=1 Tax=Trapa natans TaxID=22666 RepID=A0AAN7LTB7_TRANT|nr:hypothetical protein SAY86_013187 [Trapa natans]